jgi:tripartite-type tricarboxylate transporter receptor subunit TctC
LPFLKMKFFAFIALSALTFNLLAQTTSGWPAKPIKIIVPYPPGGPLDTTTRAVADKLKDTLNVPIVVENKPGVGGNLGADFVAKAAPDGYTLLLGAVATHAINPALYPNMPYQALRDFAPIALMASVPNVLVVNAQAAPRLGLNSLAQVLKTARAAPGRLNYASGSNGSAGHLAGELFKARTQTFIVHIPYAGAAPAQLSLLAEQTDLMFDNLASAAPQIKAGKLKALAVTTLRRSSLLPDVATIDELAHAAQTPELKRLAGFDIGTWFGLFAPANTAPEIVQRLNANVQAALATPDLKERLA